MGSAFTAWLAMPGNGPRIAGTRTMMARPSTGRRGLLEIVVADVAKQMVLNGIDATWLDDVDKVTLRRSFERDFADLDAALVPA